MINKISVTGSKIPLPLDNTETTIPISIQGPAQRNCELCVTVIGDSSDPLVGIYR